MVAVAPGHGPLAAVAAGPVESLLAADEEFAPMRQEAETNPRFRMCLSAAYGLPDDLQRYADEAPSSFSELPPAEAR